MRVACTNLAYLLTSTAVCGPIPVVSQPEMDLFGPPPVYQVLVNMQGPMRNPESRAAQLIERLSELLRVVPPQIAPPDMAIGPGETVVLNPDLELPEEMFGFERAVLDGHMRLNEAFRFSPDQGMRYMMIGFDGPLNDPPPQVIQLPLGSALGLASMLTRFSRRRRR